MTKEKKVLDRHEVQFTKNFEGSPSGYYLYVHRKATDGSIFYVGKGLRDRWKSTNRTNKHWQNIAIKHGVIVDILIQDLQEWYAYEKEAELIAHYGRLDLQEGPLANHDDGGRGGKPPELDSYSYKNFKTNEEFTGTKQQFKKKIGFHPYMLIKKQNYNLNGWYKVGNVTEERLQELKESKRSFDRTIYNFVNFCTDERLNCTQAEFKKYTGVNPCHFIARRKNSNHGWTLQEIISDIGLFKLKNPNVEVNTDMTAHTLYNLKTNEIFIGTRVEFFKKYNKQIDKLFSKSSKLEHMYSWCLLENKERLESCAYFQKYTFTHKDGEIFTGGRLDFKKEKGINLEALFYTKPSKTCKGWSLLK